MTTQPISSSLVQSAIALGTAAQRVATFQAQAQRQAMPLAAKQTLKLLENIQFGCLTLHLPNGQVRNFGSHSVATHSQTQSPQPALHGTIYLHNWEIFAASLRSGDIGFAESYIRGDWTSPDVAALLRLLIANRTAIEGAVYGRWWGRLAYSVQHWLNRNSVTQSKKNIQAHYDLGNRFYSLWLDPTWNYSSAWFAPFASQLDATADTHARAEAAHQLHSAAQNAKVRRALEMAGVQAGAKQRVLEIGCGWGALAQMGAQAFGAHMTGLTLSHEQLAHAQTRLAQAGLSEQADLRLQDYRDLGNEQFDAICSIEMVEAVGREYWPTYFGAVARALKVGGRACIQSIVIRDDLFARYIKGTDFIQQYVFPGGCLPSPSQFRAQAQAAGLRVVDELAFGQDYALTLQLWRERFTEQLEAVKAQGYDEGFIRLWTFYLAYCEAAFACGNTDVLQFTLQKD